jgi:hypothetical protein
VNQVQDELLVKAMARVLAWFKVCSLFLNLFPGPTFLSTQLPSLDLPAPGTAQRRGSVNLRSLAAARRKRFPADSSDRLTVLPPSEPIQPKIEIAEQSTVGVRDLAIDLSRCTGLQIVMGARGSSRSKWWQATAIRRHPQSNSGTHLSSSGAGQTVIVIPRASLTPGSPCRLLTLTLCNFFSVCSAASKTTSVLSVSIPSVTIAAWMLPPDTTRASL